MAIKIGFKNILVRGVQKIEITKIEGILSATELPAKYMQETGSKAYIDGLGHLEISVPKKCRKRLFC
jgi:hypothetical protein